MGEVAGVLAAVARRGVRALLLASDGVCRAVPWGSAPSAAIWRNTRDQGCGLWDCTRSRLTFQLGTWGRWRPSCKYMPLLLQTASQLKFRQLFTAIAGQTRRAC